MDTGQWRGTHKLPHCASSILMSSENFFFKTSRALKVFGGLLTTIFGLVWMEWLYSRVVMNTNHAHHSWQCYHRWHQKGPCKACVWWFHPVITRWYQLCDSLRDRRQITFDAIIIPSMICKVVFRKWQQTSCPSFLKPTWTRYWERYSSTWILSASEAAGVVSSGTLFDISLKHGIRDWRSHNWAKKEAW